MVHGLSFDVECYYQITGKDYLGRDVPPTHEARQNTEFLLDLLGDVGARATFFVLGNVARQYPRVVRRMAEEGHELGVHGDQHRYVYELTPKQFEADLRVAIDSVQQAASARVVGHRAAAFSISRETLWATDIIKEQGLRYDSSIFPIQGGRYGIEEAPRRIHKLQNGLYELPLTVVEYHRRSFPALGGGYFRMFPYAYSRWALSMLEHEKRPAITYFHPHEFELSRPRVGWKHWKASPRRALRLARFNAVQAVGRGRRMRKKLERLLREYEFAPLGELLADP